MPKIAFGKMLERALNPPEEYMVVPYTAKQASGLLSAMSSFSLAEEYMVVPYTANQTSPLKLCVCVCVNFYTYIYTHIHTYIHTYI